MFGICARISGLSDFSHVFDRTDPVAGGDTLSDGPLRS
jgi:hypothetical protein